MTSLLGYLVERSVGGWPPAAAAVAPGAGDRLQADAQEPPRTPDMQRGALRPRVRSRHKGWPDGAPGDPDARMAAEETREWLRSRDADMPQAEGRDELPVADRHAQDISAPLTVRSKEASRPSGIAPRRINLERGDIQQTGSATPASVEDAAPVEPAASQADRHAEAVLRAQPVAREQRQAWPPSVLSESAERQQPAPQPRKAEPARLSQEPDPRRGERISPALRPRLRDVETPAPPTARTARAEEARASRELPGVSPIMPLQATPERTSAPRIEVNIGRVEVRAVYAPPQPARKPASLPSTSLDDYLKQRDGTG